MDTVTALFESDQWLSIAEHPAAVLFIVVTYVVLTAMVTWLRLQLRYRSKIARQRRMFKAFASKLGGATPDEAQRRIESRSCRNFEFVQLAYLVFLASSTIALR